MPNINDVKKFWNTNPLFQDEGQSDVGSRHWFEHHEAVYKKDCIPNQETFDFITSDIQPTAKILDVGCGPGFWVRHLLQNYPHVSACDLTPRAVELTKQSLSLFNLSTTGNIIEGNAEELPFEAASFDHINCQGVIHHTPNTQKCVAEFHRVLKPGGTVCFSVYYKNFILRNPLLLKVIKNFSGRVGLKGRGRESMVKNAQSVNDLVRLYDGSDNPIGKAYTKNETLSLLNYQGIQLFTPIDTLRFFFPARALPIRIPLTLHRFLDRKMGLMIIVRATKI